MKFFIRKVIKYFSLIIGIPIGFFINARDEILILMYHRVNDSIEKELSVEKDCFRWHMDNLKRKGYRIITMDQVYEMVVSNEVRGKNIVLTFDDGYEDFYHTAYPVLKQKGFPSTVYLVPGFVGTGKVFWWDEDIGESRLLDWDQICEISGSGMVTLGSHTVNHTDINRLGFDEIVYEIKTSKEMIEKRTGKEVVHFSYPRGIYSKSAEEVVRQTYKTGVLVHSGEKIRKNFDPAFLSRIKRIPVLLSCDNVTLLIILIKCHYG
jgi:peptidoglycan/xylan/chitin deacetylase (PgdA/CDA1 family)